MDGKRREKLEGILKREKDKEHLSKKIVDNREKEPAKFRNTVLDIDQLPQSTTTKSESEVKRIRERYSPTVAAFERKQFQLEQKKQMELQRQKQLLEKQKLQQKAESERLRMVKAKRESPWTKLSTFEAEMFSRDLNAMKEATKEQIAGQRQFLDQQMKQQEAFQQAERVEQASIARQIASDVEKYKAEELALKTAEAAKNTQLKLDRDAQIAVVRNKREKLLRKQRLEEKSEVEEIKKILEIEKQKSKAKKDSEKQVAMKLMKENEERLAMRKQQDKEREKHDFLMMEQYKAMLEREEKKREESLMAMYAKARQRAQAIGEDVLAQSEATKTKLELLERQAYDDKCAEKDRQEQLKKEELKQNMQETLATLKAQQRQKEMEYEREKEELRNYYKQVKDRDAREAQAEQDKILRARLSNIANRNILFQQIKEAEERRIEEEVSMTKTEKQINTNLLSSANFILG